MTEDEYNEHLVSILEEFEKRRARLVEQFQDLEDWRDRAIRILNEGTGYLPNPNIIDGTIVVYFYDETERPEKRW